MSFFGGKKGGKKAHMAQANGYYKVITLKMIRNP